jgi:hypothetical protein
MKSLPAHVGVSKRTDKRDLRACLRVVGSLAEAIKEPSKSRARVLKPHNTFTKSVPAKIIAASI